MPRDRDVHQFIRDETETLNTRDETETLVLREDRHYRTKLSIAIIKLFCNLKHNTDIYRPTSLY